MAHGGERRGVRVEYKTHAGPVRRRAGPAEPMRTVAVELAVEMHGEGGAIIVYAELLPDAARELAKALVEAADS